ncbi:MAG: IS4 family transposase [Clostridiaceae bacterium]|nr:IS4 family transposase [Clostridiaceae bacterium]
MARILKEEVTAKQLLELIPDEEFTSIIKDTEVDYQVKKLYGRNLFYLLLYGLMESYRVSLRSLEDVYKSKKFKFLFNLNNKQSVKFNTISARLSNVNLEFFEKTYQMVYSRFSLLIPNENALSYKVTRVDSTMVCEVANKIEEGMLLSNQHTKRKHIKYTISLTELFPSSVEVFTQQAALSDDIAIPKVILKNLDKKADNIFVFDRGVQSRERFTEMSNENLSFVTRMKFPTRHELIDEFALPENLKIGNLNITHDQKVFLFGDHKKYTSPFRLIKTTNENNEPIWFLTNNFNLTINEIIEIYKRRWDIEVFFRFIKQELNFKHFMSTNINGIKIILYMTLILAMLIIMFKKLNNVGYKTAKRRFYYQLDDLILDMVYVLAKQYPDFVYRL